MLAMFGEALVDKGGDPIFGWSLGEWIVGVIVIVVVVLLVAWIGRKLGIL